MMSVNSDELINLLESCPLKLWIDNLSSYPSCPLTVDWVLISCCSLLCPLIAVCWAPILFLLYQNCEDLAFTITWTRTTLLLSCESLSCTSRKGLSWSPQGFDSTTLVPFPVQITFPVCAAALDARPLTGEGAPLFAKKRERDCLAWLSGPVGCHQPLRSSNAAAMAWLPVGVHAHVLCYYVSTHILACVCACARVSSSFHPSTHVDVFSTHTYQLYLAIQGWAP